MRTLLAHARPSSALFATLIIACAGGESRLVDPRPDTSNAQYTVRLTTKLDSLPFGESRLYVARVTDAAGAEQSVPVVWTSTNPQVLTVGAGTATAIGFGSAGLVARYANAADTATIVVSAAGFSLQVSPSAVAATLGDTLDFQARLVAPGGSSAAVQNVHWSLTDSSAATFVGDARVTTVKEGEFDVVADLGGETATASVKITQPSVSSITIDPPAASINVGESVDLNAVVRDQRGHVIRSAPVSWNVSDGAVANVDASGVVRGLSRGGVIVTATSGNKTATSTVTVAPRPAASITLTIDPATIVVGSRLQAVAVPRDAQGQPIEGRLVAYQSGNPAIATVTNTGLITAVAAGGTTISAICDGQVATAALTVQVQRVASVAIVPSAPVVLQGTTATLAASVLDQVGQAIPNAAVTWSSQSPSIVAVSSNGVLTGVALGSSQISATAGGVTGSAIATVNTQPIASVAVSPATLVLQVGQSGTLSASAFTASSAPLNGASFSWTSSNSAVATVSALGVVSAKAAGSATIAATSGGKSSSAAVTVSPIAAVPVASISVATGTSSLIVGQSTQATATLYDAQGNALVGRTVSWSSADTTVLKVSSSGFVTAVAAGTVSISASSDGRTGFTAIAVTAPPPAAVASVSVSAASTSLQVGQTSQMAVTLRDAGGNTLTGRTILYASSNTSIAMVSTSGLVTARAAGAASIVVTSEGVSGSMVYTIVSVPLSPTLTQISLTPATVTLSPGGVAQFAVAGAWSDGSTTVPGVTYSATGGTITAGGAYTAGAAQGTFRVIATQQGGTKADTSTVMISAPVATLLKLVLTPASLALAPGGSAQFSVAATWSDGSSTVPAVTYTATGGAITPGGYYTAGSTAGTYRVIVRQSAGSTADTSAVTIAALPLCVGSTTIVCPGESIQAKVDAAAAGTAFTIKAGTHRLQSVVPKSGDTFTGEPGAIMSGAKVLSGWVRDGTRWYVGGQTQQRAPRGYNSIVCAGGSPRCDNPEDLWMDNALKKHVADVSGVTSGTWYFDYAADRIYVGDDPTGRVVETSVSEFAFTNVGATNVTIERLVVEKYANKEQSGAIGGFGGAGGMGRGWIVQDNEVRSNHGSGIACSNYATILRNNVHHQGQIGITEGCGLVEGNEIAYNNTVGYNAAWEAGGSKWAFTDALIVRRNFVHHNHGPGLWTDINNVNAVYEENRVEDNDGPGISHEISYKAVIRNNIIRRNGASRPPWVEGAGILIWSSRDVEIYGNTVEDNWGGGIYGVNADRGTGTLGKYEVRNFWVHDNTITMSRGVNGLEGDGTAPLFTTFNNHWDRNTYHVTGIALPFNWLGAKTWAQWQAAGNDANGVFTP